MGSRPGQPAHFQLAMSFRFRLTACQAPDGQTRRLQSDIILPPPPYGGGAYKPIQHTQLLYCCCRSLCKPYTPRHRHPLSGPHMYTASHPSPIAYVGICYKGLRCISIRLCRCDCDTPGGRFADYHPDPDPDVISCQLHRPNSFFSATRGGEGRRKGFLPKFY